MVILMVWFMGYIYDFMMIMMLLIEPTSLV